MGRKQRIDYNGACHHIVVKGINNSYIFDDDTAKATYLRLLTKYREKHDIKLFAYCVMDNHAHLLIQTGQAKGAEHICISDYMHDVQSAYARWYNKEYAHRGPVFNNRYSSFCCQTLAYFIFIINYIHKNPVKHGKTESYSYQYSSYRDYQLGTGICDLKACYAFLEMSRTELLKNLAQLRANEGYPVLDRLIEKLSSCQSSEAVEALLLELTFHIEDIRGSRLVKYFHRVQHDVIRELRSLKIVSVKALSSMFCVSPSYIYKLLKSP